MADFSLADILGAQTGAPGPVYEGGPPANVTLGSVLSALGPSWLERAQQQAAADAAAYQRGGVPAMMGDTTGGQELAGGFVGSTTPKGIRAYHGSPYDFEKFDLSRIGTGEGAQAYGHGLYFAENPTVAAEYRRQLAGGSEKLVGGEEYNSANPEHLAASLAHTFKGDRLIPIKELTADIANPNLTDAARQNYAETIKILNSGQPLLPVEMKPRGKMYEVNINAKPEQFLDWEKPLSQQPNREAIIRAADRADLPIHENFVNADPTGERLYHTLTPAGSLDQRASGLRASPIFQDAGIPGIKYLDQGSRNAATDLETSKMLLRSYEGRLQHEPDDSQLRAMAEATRREIADASGPTSNYVVFNPAIVDILKKYGLAGVTMAGVLQGAGTQPPQQ